MAQHEEPMDIDSSVCDFDDKENAFHHNNALPRTPCTEKGYEELDVSELNMKLRYSVTPAASPMSKSYAGNIENRNYESDNTLDVVNANMTRSLNSTLTKNETFNKSQKTLPLQTLPTDHGQVADGNRNVLQPLDTTLTVDKNINVTVSRPNDDENISLPSSSSSMIHTPEATTPTKEIPKIDGGSPIIRGLKTVLNMFRPSQSPIPGEDDMAKLETLSPPIVNSPNSSADNKNQSVSASTPLVGNKTKDPLSKRKSPNRDSLVFNEDLEKELEWKDDSTIIFSHEKIPIHKLFFQQSQTEPNRNLDLTKSANDGLEKLNQGDNLNATVEYMDVSYNDSGIMEKTTTQVLDFNKSGITNPESDSEFLDCESTFTKNESFKSQGGNELNSTEDVLAHINDIVESNNTNDSVSTLNGSDVKSTNLSMASVETTKALDMSNEPLQCATEMIKDFENMPAVEELQKDNILQDNQSESGRNAAKIEDLDTNDAVPAAVSFEKDPNTTLVINLDSSDAIKSNQTVENNVSDINAPVLDNVGVKSLSQIPLIVDPRVLLFNIPLDSDGDKKNEVVVEDILKSSPADIPLPEDDDIPSLPVMNSELESISHTLDKIAEEIPKINQHESSVSSVDFMSDQRSTVSPTENNFTPIVECSENSDPQMSSCPKVVESLVSGLVESPVSAEGKDTLGVVDISLPNFTNDTKLENVSLSSKPVKITDENNGFVLKPEIDYISSTQVSFDDQSRSEVINNPSIIESKEIEVLEPMDISLTDVCVIEDTKMAQVITVNERNLNDSGLEPQTSPDNTNHKDVNNVEADSDVNTKTSDKVNHCVTFNPVLLSYFSETIDANTHMTASNIEFIKQEVEAIVSKAVDIATKKTSESLQEPPKSDDKTSEDETVTDDFEQDAIKSQAHVQDHMDPAKHGAIQDLNGTTVISNDENSNQQQISLNQLSDNKYSYTVQDNNLVPEINDDFVKDFSSSVPNSQEIITANPEKLFMELPEETPIASNSTTIDLNDNTGTKLETCEENVRDVTSLDKENIEKETADEEVTTSPNHSPFVLVAEESQVADDMQPAENLASMENSFSSNSEISMAPPSSPKIVSKGYNYNFDEIDDPFATKTKIRMSPAQDSSPNQSFEVTKKPEAVKKEVNKNIRRKSQPDRRRPVVNNKKFNSTFSGTSSTKPNSTTVALESVAKAIEPAFQNIEIESSNLKEIESNEQLLDKTKEIMDITVNSEIKSTTESVVVVPNENKGTSSSEQSTYFSASTSSNETTGIKSEIKIPDLDDPNFDPFASKSKIRQSPTPENISNPFVTRTRICQTPPPSQNDDNNFTTSGVSISTEVDTECPNPCLPNNNKKCEFENSFANIPMNIETSQGVTFENIVKTDNLEEKESSDNISIMTSSSNNDKENTVREVNTEDEDTMEGPFLEVDEIQIEDKMSDFDTDNVNMIKFSDLPPENGENADAGELFIDAEAFEFLLNQNKANTVTDSGKESLFLKFDPLFAKRMSSDGVMAALKQVQVKQSTPIKNNNLPIPRDATFDVPPVSSDLTFDKSSPLPGTSCNRTQEIDPNSTAEESFDDLNVTVSKPMMVVNPAVNPVVTPRNKTITPVRSNRQSLTFTSPAIAVIDRLLSMSAGNNSLMAHDTTVAEVHRDNEADLALTQLRELLADKEISVYNLRSETKELQNRLATLDSQMKNLETISEDRLKKINELNGKLDEKTKINKKMAQVVEEYERTIASLISEKELDKKRHAEERLQLIKERDEQTAHLASMEVSFSDLHSKYEKSKQIILSFKANEDTYKKSIKEFEENLAKMQNNYELLKQHATSKLNHANEELQKINKAHEAEVLKMNAMIKRKELHITSLEETLQQKTKANEELTAICDELINKVG